MKKQSNRMIRGLLISLCVFAVLLLAGNALINWVDSSSSKAENELVETAVRSAALTCYAVEGAYPEDIGYLRERYGLIYDEDTYLVIYDAFASNLMPDIQVLERGSGWQ